MNKITASLLLIVLFAPSLSGQRNTPCHDREPGVGSFEIADRDEPGRRLVIHGRVVVGDERRPVVGARVLAFHTDDKGYYSVGGMDESQARLCGVVLTDQAGFRFETIRPAHYATGGPPAHVHFEVRLPDGRDGRFTLQFEGDPKLEGQKAGEVWDRIRSLEDRVDGALVVERDLWLR